MRSNPSQIGVMLQQWLTQHPEATDNVLALVDDLKGHNTTAAGVVMYSPGLADAYLLFAGAQPPDWSQRM